MAYIIPKETTPSYLRGHAPIRIFKRIVRRSDLFYAAGLLEGEGCFGNTIGIYIEAKMTDREPLDRLVTLFGGRVTGPHLRKNKKHKPIYRWSIRRNSGCLCVMLALRPLLSPRRRVRIEEHIAYAKNKPAHKHTIRKEEEKAHRRFAL